MKPKCAEAVNQAVGREMTKQELDGIEQRIRRQMQMMGQKDPHGTMAMTAEQRYTQAAQLAAAEAKSELALKAKRVALGIKAQARIDRYAESLGGDRLEAVDRLLAFSPDMKSGVQSVESQARAIRDHAISQMLDIVDATKGRLFGLLNDPKATQDLVRELHGQETGNALAKQAAKSFHDVTESLRQRFNAAGGKVGRLEDYGMPHSHSQAKVAKAGPQAWIKEVFPLLNRQRYTNDDGTRMNDQELQTFLREAWTTIATDGANKIEPGQAMGHGMRANAGSERRSIHFKDGDSYLKYQEAFGDSHLLDALIGHVDKSARDIALIETLGPNPNHTIRTLLDRGVQEQSIAAPLETSKLKGRRRKIENLFNDVSGSKETAPSQALADGFDTYRNLNVAARLGSAVLTSITDQGVMAMMAHMHNMPVMKVFSNELKMLNPLNAEHRQLAQRAGLGLNQLIGSLNRFGADGLSGRAELSSRLAKTSQAAASKVLQISGMNALTAGSQRAFGVTMMDALGSLAKSHGSIGEMAHDDARLLRSAGISDLDFAVWKLAKPEDWTGRGDTILTADSIYKIPDDALHNIMLETGQTAQQVKDQAATRLLGLVQDETSMAIIEPGARERTAMHGQSIKGTAVGELNRSFWQFKSFTVAMMMRHYERAMSQETIGGKAGYIAILTGVTTILGAVALQLNEVAQGKDPRAMDDTRFRLASLMKGGALGIYGDFIFGNNTGAGQSALAAALGPIAGDFESAVKIVQESRDVAFADGKANVGGDITQFVKGHIPAANLWYTKAITDHLIFQQLQEMFSPGYLGRMKGRVKKQFGQEYWWNPGEVTPDRAPDLSAAGGR